MTPTTVPAYHATLAPSDRAICEALRDRIDSALPEGVSKMWHAHPVTFLDGNPIVGYSKLKTCIWLMFWSGQSFSAPGLTPSGSFKAAEVRYTDVSRIDHDALSAWLAEAREVQWDYKNITRNKGRLDRI